MSGQSSQAKKFLEEEARPSAGRAPIHTLCDILTRLEREHRKLGLLRYKEDGKWTGISSEDFVSVVRSLALGLAALGVAKGDRVGLLSENRPEWVAFDQAILNLGAVTVPLYPILTTEQTRYILEHSEAKVLVVSTDRQLAKGLPCLFELPTLTKIVMMDAREEYPPETLPWSALIEEGEAVHKIDPGRFDGFRSRVSPEDLASIVYTSGTTGEPKGVMLTHGNFASNVNATLAVIPFRTTDVAISFLPLSHALERLVGFIYLCEGATVAYAESVETVPTNLQEIRPSVVVTVPRLLEKAYAGVREAVGKTPWHQRLMFKAALRVGREVSQARLQGRPASRLASLFLGAAQRSVLSRVRDKVFGPRVRFVVSGGAPLSMEIAEFFYALGVPVIEGYGLTETSPVISVNRLDRARIGTVGPLLPEVEVKIAGDGEILARGPNVMLGYYRNEEATREALVDGWFHTGDIGELDGDGFLKITDRKKELIKTSGGKMVAPQPIENLLKTDPAISQAVVVGDRRKFISALVVPDFEWLEGQAKKWGIASRDPEMLVTEERIVGHYRHVIDSLMKKFAPYERVKKFRLLTRELSQKEGEMTPSLKVKRRVVEEKFGELISSMYED